MQNSLMNMLILKYLLYSPVAICVWSSGLKIDFGSKPYKDGKVIEMMRSCRVRVKREGGRSKTEPYEHSIEKPLEEGYPIKVTKKECLKKQEGPGWRGSIG